LRAYGAIGFIPLPVGSESRHQFVGRFGNLDVFHFDPYSTALCKIERGRTQDFEDVLKLLDAGRIDWARLEGCFQDVLPRFGTQASSRIPASSRRTSGHSRRCAREVRLRALWSGPWRVWLLEAVGSHCTAGGASVRMAPRRRRTAEWKIHSGIREGL
jgi:hypothetical protein